MSIRLTDSLKKLFKETALELRGPAKRKFMAQVVLELGDGGQWLAERELNWNRTTIRKGIKELVSGKPYIDKHYSKGRRRTENHLPELLEDIKQIVESQATTVSTFQEERTYTDLTADEIRKKLIREFNYSEQQLPTIQTIRTKLNSLGYYLKRVKDY